MLTTKTVAEWLTQCAREDQTAAFRAQGLADLVAAKVEHYRSVGDPLHSNPLSRDEGLLIVHALKELAEALHLSAMRWWQQAEAADADPVKLGEGRQG